MSQSHNQSARPPARPTNHPFSELTQNQPASKPSRKPSLPPSILPTFYPPSEHVSRRALKPVGAPAGDKPVNNSSRVGQQQRSFGTTLQAARPTDRQTDNERGGDVERQTQGRRMTGEATPTNQSLGPMDSHPANQPTSQWLISLCASQPASHCRKPATAASRRP